MGGWGKGGRGGGGDKNKFQSKHSLSLIGGYLFSFHCSSDVQFRHVSMNKCSEDKTSKQIV